MCKSIYIYITSKSPTNNVYYIQGKRLRGSNCWQIGGSHWGQEQLGSKAGKVAVWYCFLILEKKVLSLSELPESRIGHACSTAVGCGPTLFALEIRCVRESLVSIGKYNNEPPFDPMARRQCVQLSMGLPKGVPLSHQVIIVLHTQSAPIVNDITFILAPIIHGTLFPIPCFIFIARAKVDWPLILYLISNKSTVCCDLTICSLSWPLGLSSNKSRIT